MPAACARTGSESSGTTRAAKESSTTSPSRCLRSSTRASSSAGRRRSTSSTRTRDGALADLDDELRELKEALAETGEPAPEVEPDAHVFEEVGDVLFAAVNVARRLNVDPELALRSTSRRFADRVERAELLAHDDGRVFAELPLDEQDRYFDAAKEMLR